LINSPEWYHQNMNHRDQWLFCDLTELIKDCRVDRYKSSGPGGQHKNKVETAIRVVHKPSGLSACGQQTRSQLRNKTLALRNLRMHIACSYRQPQDLTKLTIPDEIAEYLQPPAASAPQRSNKRKLSLASGNWYFWPVVAIVLDVFDSSQGQLSTASTALGISTANLAAFLRSDRHLLQAAQAIRTAHNHTPLR
jgi:hypothetical protein